MASANDAASVQVVNAPTAPPSGSLLDLVTLVLEAVDIPAAIVAGDGNVISANSAARALIGSPDPASSDQRLPLNDVDGGACWIRRPMRGLDAVDWQIATRRAAGTGSPARRTVERLRARWSLTARQSEVLGLVVQGISNECIAEQLGLRLRTVEFHLTALFDKAGVNGRVSLIAAVMRLWETAP